MRTVSYSECDSFEEVRKLFERVFTEIDDINFVIAPEKAKRLQQLAKDRAILEAKAKADAEKAALADAESKKLIAAQLVISNDKAQAANRIASEKKQEAALAEAKKIVAAAEKKGGK